jgi:hypothetical protein
MCQYFRTASTNGTKIYLKSLRHEFCKPMRKIMCIVKAVQIIFLKLCCNPLCVCTCVFTTCAWEQISSMPVHIIGKSKAVPLQAWSGPEGCRKLSFPDFLTTTQDGGKVVSPKHRPLLPPGNTPGTHFC